MSDSFKSYRAFVTGSYAYGYPNEKSDIDLVVYVTPEDLEKLQNMADSDDGPSDAAYISAGGIPLRFGDLNLICVCDEKMYEVWLSGTKKLKRQKPVSRDFAIKFFRDLRRKAGLHQPDDDDLPQTKRQRGEDIPF